MKSNGELKLENNVPIPKRTGGHGSGLSDEALLLQKMKKGQSLLLSKKFSAVYAFTRRHLGVGNFTVRAEGKGFRVWRTK